MFYLLVRELEVKNDSICLKRFEDEFQQIKASSFTLGSFNIKLSYTFWVKAMFLYAGTSQKSDQLENKADNWC